MERRHVALSCAFVSKVSHCRLTVILLVVDMRTFTLEISKPRDADDFEDYCTDIYSVVFDDPLPKRNGRSGQSQGGVDIFVEPPQRRRKGIQCKRYYETKITTKLIDGEVEAADRAGWNIDELIIATTTSSDSKLVKYAQDLSDRRFEGGKFKVSLEFWGDVCNHINRFATLQRKYSPNAAGGVFDEIRVSLDEVQTSSTKATEFLSAIQGQMSGMLAQLGAANLSRSPGESQDFSVFTRQLDKIAELVRGLNYSAAGGLLSAVFGEMNALSSHQKGRWYLLSGIVDWHLGDMDSAARKFDTAYEIYPEDERICAGKVRGLMLKGNDEQALEFALEALRRFPDSNQVWFVWANARVKLAAYLEEADLPVKFQNEADALQIMAVNFHDAGDTHLSLSYAQRALNAPGGGFHTWSNVLYIATDIASREPYRLSMGLVSEEFTHALETACACFEPRAEKLWRVEGAASRSDAAANLAIGKLLLGDSEGCLAVCEEAVLQGEPSIKFAAARVYAHRELGDLRRTVQVGEESLPLIHVSAQVFVAEAAANLGDVDVVRKVAALSSVAEDVEARETLQALLWVALRNSGDGAAAIEAMDEHQFETEQSVTLLSTAVRIYLALNEEQKAHAIGECLEARVTEESEPPTKIQAVDALIAIGSFDKAIDLLRSIPDIQKSRPLQTRLLAAYVSGGYRAKARGLLDEAREDWFDDEEFVQLAINAARQANDWHRLKPLALRHLDRCRNDARAWNFWYQVALHTLKPADVRRVFSEAPLEVGGGAQSVRRLALAELEYGDAALGMRRLYRMFRCNLEDATVAAGYVTALIVAQDVPLGAAPESFGTGVAAMMVREDGTPFEMVMDPPDVGNLPPAQNFFASSSLFCSSFVGCAVGDTVTVLNSIGEPTSYLVSSLMPAARYLLNHAHKLIEKSVEPIPGFISVPAFDKSGAVDTKAIHTQVKRLSERSSMVIDGYRQGRLTVGLCAQLLGRTPVDILLGWGKGLPPLVISEGATDILPTWRTSFAAATACVVDCISLIELGLFKNLSALSAMPHPLVSQRTYDYLHIALEEARNDRTLGAAADVAGKLTLVSYTSEDRKRKVDLLTEVIAAVEDNCEVAPAYGPADVPRDLLTFKDVLDEESYDAVALALERSAILVSLDARLRAIASTFSVTGVPPLAVVAHAAGVRRIDEADFRFYLMLSLVSNRTYVSIGAHDFLWMLAQAGWSTVALDTYAEVVGSSATAFNSAVNAVCGVFRSLHLMDMQYGVVGKVIEGLAGAIFRHPSFEGWAERAMADALKVNATMVFDAPPWHQTLVASMRRGTKNLWEFSEQALMRGQAIAAGTFAPEVRDFDSLYCMNRPLLLLK